ncbi:hypothetical protein [Mangrovibacterium marinum]|uniref:Uncharacterized protein n=1 Tax=Mangrovibacterium marinum TaxID=1639118 RepID=A0A2T5BXZ6_9BACT|nr:hypothetical protein [Mangrovibacterium marinum]PTN06285.1 hypothetical protein C8N47_1236 [Mangrovibacterium marinum]
MEENNCRSFIKALSRKVGPVTVGVPAFMHASSKFKTPVLLTLAGGDNTGVRCINQEENTQLKIY